MKKKLISTLLCVSMVAAMVAGCDQGMTQRMLTMMHPTQKEQQMQIRTQTVVLILQK